MRKNLCSYVIDKIEPQILLKLLEKTASKKRKGDTF